MVEQRAAVRVAPVFHQPANAVLRPDQTVAQSRYLLTNWLPRLGPERYALVLVLRQLAQEGAARSQQVQISVQALAPRLGLTPKALYRLLDSEPIPDTRAWRQLRLPAAGGGAHDQVAALRQFIPRLRYRYERAPETGTLRRLGFQIEIALDDPLTPADQARVNAEFGIHSQTCDSPNRESRPVNADLGIHSEGCDSPNRKSQPVNAENGKRPSVNLRLTVANATGCAAAPSCPDGSLSPAAPPASPLTSQSEAALVPPVAQGLPAVDTSAPPAAHSLPTAGGSAAPTGVRPESTLAIDLNLPLPQLRQAALRDLERVRKNDARTSIVTRFMGRLSGLGWDDGLPRAVPTHADYARVGELCREYGHRPTLERVFAIAGRLPLDCADPLAYLRVALERQRAEAAAARTPGAAPGPQLAAGYGAAVDVGQFTLADYAASLPGGSP